MAFRIFADHFIVFTCNWTFVTGNCFTSPWDRGQAGLKLGCYIPKVSTFYVEKGYFILTCLKMCYLQTRT